MIKNLDKEGLKTVVLNYDLFFIDIWGVVHNGIQLYKQAIEVLSKLEENKKEFVLLTNAPRPNKTVIEFLKKIGLESYHQNVFTSGEAALRHLRKNLYSKKFYHVGPPRDFDLFSTFKNQKAEELKLADYILCTGLFDSYEDDLNYYKNLLTNHISKKMICTNPDLIVDRGERREYCAGSIAKIFEEINGKVTYFGKPHPPIYNLSINLKDKKVLCIGDNLNTDIKGANVQNFDSLLITNGIHRKEILEVELNQVLKQYKVNVDYIQKNLKW